MTTVTVTVTTTRFHRGEHAEARHLVLQELARQGLRPAARPRGPHTFAHDGIRSMRANGRTWTAVVAVEEVLQ